MKLDKWDLTAVAQKILNIDINTDNRRGSIVHMLFFQNAIHATPLT